MTAFLIILGIIAILLLICVIRTLTIKPQTTKYEPSTDQARIDDYAQKLSKMIQCETVSYPNYEDVKKFRKFHKVLEKNFPTVFKELEKIEIDGNLMMKWKGTDPTLDPIIMISHQDVVPAEGPWTHDPFGGEISDGRIWGRGTGDIKEGVFCFYQAAEELLKAGYTPKCDVYLGSSCTEEIGGDGAPKMVNWFKEQGIHLFMLSDEGGAIVEDPVAGVKGTFAAIGIFEKGYGDLKFTAKSIGGHSSTPPKNTPIVRLAKFEAEVEKHNPFKVEFCPAVDNMFGNLAPYCSSFGLKMVMCNLWLFKPILKIAMPSISSQAAAMLQTTIAFTMQKGSDGANVIPQEAYVIGNLRFIPHQNKDESVELISNLAKKYDIETTVLKANSSSNALDLDSDPYKITTECIKKVFPEIGIMPYVVTGGTDSRFFDPVCDHCVRFSPILMDNDQMSRMHGIDENIYTNTLPNGVDYYKELIKAQEKR